MTKIQQLLLLSLLSFIGGSALFAEYSSDQVVQAALDGQISIVKQAIDDGFSVDFRDAEERTLLMYAAFNGHKNIVEFLIEKLADVNAWDKGGSTALMFAASGPSSDTVKCLIEHKAKVNVVDKGEGFNALMWASAEGQVENVKLLLKHDANVHHIDKDGDTAEMFATNGGHYEIVKLLKEASTKSKSIKADGAE